MVKLASKIPGMPPPLTLSFSCLHNVLVRMPMTTPTAISNGYSNRIWVTMERSKIVPAEVKTMASQYFAKEMRSTARMQEME